MEQSRLDQAKWTVWLGIGVNAGLAIMIGIVGILARSNALIADAIHSATDVVGSIAVWIGLRAASRPPDFDHPYGHGKAETLSAVIVAVLIGVVGVQVLIRSVEALFSPAHVPGMSALIVAGVSILSKELLFRYQIRVGKKLNSQAIIANAWDFRSDVFSTFAALLGIAGSRLAPVVGIPQLAYLDALAGIIVSFFIFFMSYRLARESIHAIMDHVLHDERANQMWLVVSKVEGVRDVEGLRAREHGSYVIVDVVIAVDPGITVAEGHKIGRRVKQTLLDAFTFVNDVFVHVNPLRQK